jgi:hypothetical protein
VSTYVNSFFEKRVDQLFELAHVIEQIFSSAHLEYRIVGGLATYLYVEQKEPDAGRLTKDIDIAVCRDELMKIAAAAKNFGFEHRHVSGVDMLVPSNGGSARKAVHLIFAGERVRPDYSQPVPKLGSHETIQGLKLIPLADLLRMKLTSFRIKDQTHIKDLDEAGLLTPQIESEAELSTLLRDRLRYIREHD